MKIFKKIRKVALKSSNYKAYLLYALGEIILVVIGILIALQLNIRNEHNKAVAQSEVYLEGVIQDITLMNDNLTKTVKAMKGEQLVEEELIGKNEFVEADLKNLKYMVYTGSWVVLITDHTFEQIQNSGKGKLVGFESLYASISNYYTSDRIPIDSDMAWEKLEGYNATGLKAIIESEVEKDLSFFEGVTFSHPDVKVSLGEGQVQNDKKLLEIMNTPLGRNFIKSTYLRHYAIINSLQRYHDKGSDLLEAIQEKLVP